MKHSIKSSWWGRVRRGVLGLAGLLGLAGVARAQGPVFDRVSECGQSPSSSNFLLEKIAVDAAGNTYATGFFEGAALFGATILTSAGGKDWWVAKLDAAGAVAWAVRGGGPGEDRPYGLALDGQGHVFVGGQAQGQAVFGAFALNNNPQADAKVAVARLDAGTGAWQWLAAGGDDANNECRGLAADGRGHVYVGGRTGVRGSIVQFGAVQLRPYGDGDLFAARLDAGTGAWQWATLAGATQVVELHTTALALDGAGGVYTTGTHRNYTAPVLFGPALALPLMVGGSGSDVFVAKLDTAGAWRWVSNGGGPDGTDEPQALAADAAGNVVVSGFFSSTAPRFGATTLANTSGLDQFGYLFDDGLVAGLDAGTGAWRWAVATAGVRSEFCRGVALDRAGDAYVTGFANGPATVGPLSFSPAIADVFAARLDAATGRWRWAVAGGGGRKYSAVSALGPGGTLYVGGLGGNAAQMNFGPVALAGAPGLMQGFVARLAGAAGPLGVAPAGGLVPLGLAVWPNPAPVGGLVQVQGLAAGALVQVFDATGREVARLRPAGPVGGAVPAELLLPAGLPPGLYLLRAGRQTAKLQLE